MMRIHLLSATTGVHCCGTFRLRDAALSVSSPAHSSHANLRIHI